MGFEIFSDFDNPSSLPEYFPINYLTIIAFLLLSLSKFVDANYGCLLKYIQYLNTIHTTFLVLNAQNF